MKILSCLEDIWLAIAEDTVSHLSMYVIYSTLNMLYFFLFLPHHLFGGEGGCKVSFSECTLHITGFEHCPNPWFA